MVVVFILLALFDARILNHQDSPSIMKNFSLYKAFPSLVSSCDDIFHLLSQFDTGVRKLQIYLCLGNCSLVLCILESDCASIHYKASTSRCWGSKVPKFTCEGPDLEKCNCLAPWYHFVQVQLITSTF